MIVLGHLNAAGCFTFDQILCADKGNACLQFTGHNSVQEIAMQIKKKNCKNHVWFSFLGLCKGLAFKADLGHFSPINVGVYGR